jgi:ribonucleoside-diphosphate reductase alpha chain
MGIKAVAIYRDNCKVAQPLSTTKKEGAAADPNTPAGHDAELAIKVAELEKALEIQTVVVKQPVRERLPKRRKGATFKFRVADCEGYVTISEYADGRPGEMFLKVSKQGSTLAGIMDAFSISISLGLQHGVPLETFVAKFAEMRFEPLGMTDDPDVPTVTSVGDYLARRLAADWLDLDARKRLNVLTPDEEAALPADAYAPTPLHPAVAPGQ